MSAKIEQVLNKIGVKLNGDNPCDIKVHNKQFLNRILKEQSIGAGESYMDGWWDCDRLDELFYRLCREKIATQFYSPLTIGKITAINSIINQQSRSKSEIVANKHYNLGNTLYELMLGKSMAYTCGYWKDVHTLDEAQYAKYDLVCKKLYLKRGEKVLEIGTGWGGLAKFMAERYGCEVVGMDIGRGPSAYAKEFCKNFPVEIYRCDYRDVNVYNPNKIKFDKIVSVGVLEHVGVKNYRTLLDIARSMLKPDGLFLLHSIGGNTSKNYCDPWINKHIFPNGMLPSLQQIGKAFEDKFIVEDLHNIGANYEKTLLGWHENFNNHWDTLQTAFDERFHRMMNYYLLSCAGAFRARDMQLWQFVLSPNGIINGYTRIR